MKFLDKLPYRAFYGYISIFFLICAFNLFGQEEQTTTASSPIILQVKNREISVNGKKSQVYQVAQPDGTQGIYLKKGDQFNVIVENHIERPTGIHWHGIILPNNQDGVPFVTQFPIPPGGKYPYNFPLIQSGTYWMHAHYGLQEQQLLAAPLILFDEEKNESVQDVVMFLSDFSFKNPHEIFKELQNQGSKVKLPQSHPSKDDSPKKMTMEMPHTGDNDKKSNMNMEMDLNDVKYDAFLTNWRTLQNPEVIEVTSEKEVRLRVINGSSSTNFFIFLGALKGKLISVDGSEIEPIEGSKFEIAVAQRIDILLKIPLGRGVYPIFAQVEGLKMQTGLVLATSGSVIPKYNEEANEAVGALTYEQEFLLKPKNPLSKKEIDRHLTLNLEGNMSKYIWMLNGKVWPYNEPLMVKQGERVEIAFVNRTMMAHPMHLHGHFFQITEIDGKKLEGALRDTVLVLPHSTVKVQFDAVHPGNWPLHCHNLYHQYAGMMTTLNYEGFKGPVFTIEEKLHE